VDNPDPAGPPQALSLPRRWLVIFGGSLALLLIRFLIPGPAGQADNRDGPRLMCGRGLGLGPVYPHQDPRFFRFAYFQYAPSPACAHHGAYLTSELVPLELARLLTKMLGLPGTLNLIALGVLMCVLAAAGIASLAIGLRIGLRVQLLVAAALVLIMADAAFFDVFASPFEEPAAVAGLLLVAAGVLYLGRSSRATAAGLALAGAGGIAVALSKEQYVPLAVPICLTLVLASARRGDGRLARRLMTRQAAAAVLLAAILAAGAGFYAARDASSRYGQRLHHIQAVDTIFTGIVNGHDNAAADLHALGLPGSWARYAGHYYWDTGSVRKDPLYLRYQDRLTETTIAGFLLTHPGRMAGIGQRAALEAGHFRVTALGNYPPSAGHPPGAVESRVVAVSWLARQVAGRLGLFWLLPLWAAMAAVALVALRRSRGWAWHRDAATLILCMTGCAVVAFIPPAYFEAISTTRHMAGMNLATALAVPVATALAWSLAAAALRNRHTAPMSPGSPSRLNSAGPAAGPDTSAQGDRDEPSQGCQSTGVAGRAHGPAGQGEGADQAAGRAQR
jgi:hypothetical protein